MKYLLTTLNRTDSRAKATKDFIKMGFSIDPRDIRYDDKDIPCVNKHIGALDSSDRSIAIGEKISRLVETISRNINSEISVDSTEETDKGIEVSLSVREEQIKLNI